MPDIKNRILRIAEENFGTSDKKIFDIVKTYTNLVWRTLHEQILHTIFNECEHLPHHQVRTEFS